MTVKNSTSRIKQRREIALATLERNLNGEKAKKFPECKKRMEEEIETLKSRIR